MGIHPARPQQAVGRLSAISLAVAAVLAAGASAASAQTVISGTQIGVNWTSGSLTLDSTAKVYSPISAGVGGSPDAISASGTLGTLTNNGTVTALFAVDLRNADVQSIGNVGTITVSQGAGVVLQSSTIHALSNSGSFLGRAILVNFESQIDTLALQQRIVSGTGNPCQLREPD